MQLPPYNGLLKPRQVSVAGGWYVRDDDEAKKTNKHIQFKIKKKRAVEFFHSDFLLPFLGKQVMGWSGFEGWKEFVICFCVVRHPERNE